MTDKITTSVVYMTACDLDTSFSFDMTAEIQATCAFQFICKHTVIDILYAIFPELWESETFRTVKVTFKITQGHWYRSNLIDHV